ncbi:hypothetical protein PtB15_13B230 [Puccinia triticina]|nr:hypothetical protein PtB15_13B230 [Puccinia triticina]
MASGSTRRPQARRPTQTQIAAEARFLQNVEAGRRMGLIPEAQTPPTTKANGDTAMGTEEANEPAHQPAFKDNQQNQWEDYDPILAHASYHSVDVPLDSCTCLPNEIENHKVDLIDLLCMFFSSSHDLP